MGGVGGGGCVSGASTNTPTNRRMHPNPHVRLCFSTPWRQTPLEHKCCTQTEVGNFTLNSPTPLHRQDFWLTVGTCWPVLVVTYVVSSQRQVKLYQYMKTVAISLSWIPKGRYLVGQVPRGCAVRRAVRATVPTGVRSALPPSTLGQGAKLASTGYILQRSNGAQHVQNMYSRSMGI